MKEIFYQKLMRITVRNNIMYPTLPDGEYTAKPYEPPRNADQNALLWALYTLVERETGNDKEYLHELMKKKYLSQKKLIKLKGKRQFATKTKSTTKLTRKEFSEFYFKVEQFFAELGYVLPPRDSLDFQNLISSYS